MGPLIERKGWGPFEEVANAYYRHSGASSNEFFVVGPINGVARIKRLVVNVGGEASGIAEFGFSLSRESVASEAGFTRGEDLLQRSNRHFFDGVNTIRKEIFDSIALNLDIPLSRWLDEGSWFVQCFERPSTGNYYTNFLVSVVSDRWMKLPA